MQAIVTGGAGFIGSHLADTLIAISGVSRFWTIYSSNRRNSCRAAKITLCYR